MGQRPFFRLQEMGGGVIVHNSRLGLFVNGIWGDRVDGVTNSIIKHFCLIGLNNIQVKRM